MELERQIICTNCGCEGATNFSNAARQRASNGVMAILCKECNVAKQDAHANQAQETKLEKRKHDLVDRVIRWSLLDGGEISEGIVQRTNAAMEGMEWRDLPFTCPIYGCRSTFPTKETMDLHLRFVGNKRHRKHQFDHNKQSNEISKKQKIICPDNKQSNDFSKSNGISKKRKIICADCNCEGRAKFSKSAQKRVKSGDSA